MNVLRRSSVRGRHDNPWPAGVRFHPTDEEIIICYLKRKISGQKIMFDVVADIDVYKCEPEDLPGLSKLQTGDRQWYFFTPIDRKYENGARLNRKTRHGFWKATGKKLTVTSKSRNVGVRRTLVFHKGRGRSSKRTDWVMHEYTMDKKELSSCKNVQGYYAVYKVKKKSGLGPKNGEQYGAPVNEDDLADDSDDQEILAEEPETDTTVIEGETCQATISSSDDIDIWMELISFEAPSEFPGTDPCANSLPQVGGPGESVSTVIDQRSQDDNLRRSVEASDSEQQLSNAPESFDLTKSISQLQTPEAKYAPNFSEPASFPLEGDFLEMADLSLRRSVEASDSEQQPSNARESFNLTKSDISQLRIPEAKSAPNFSELASFPSGGDFLEMADLRGPEIQSNTENPYVAGNLPFEDLNASMCELDRRRDVEMFLKDLGPFGNGTVPNIYQNENVNNVASSLDGQFQSNPDCADASHIDYQMPMPDPALNGFALSEMQQTSGELCGPSNFSAETNHNQVGADESSASRISSALWAFVESIPATPASAAENGLVNRTFDRTSSFDRRRISMKSTTVSAIDSSSLMSRRTESRNRKGGFFLLSVLGALCAILWVFIGAVRLWQRCFSLQIWK